MPPENQTPPGFTQRVPDGWSANRKLSQVGLGENNGDLLEEDLGATSSESALDVTSGLPVIHYLEASC